MKQLAKISSASLSFYNGTILSFYIHVDYEEGCSQGVGGITLDTYCKASKSRVGTAYGCEVIRRLLLELGVDDFSEMKGKHIWVHGEGSGGFDFKPTGIQAMATDNKKSKPVIWSEILKEFPIEDDNDESTETDR